jgi:alpha-galactosidase
VKTSDISRQIKDSWEGSIELADNNYQIQIAISSKNPVELQITSEAHGDLADTYLIRLKLTAPADAHFYIDNLSFKWLVPAVDVHGLYFGGDPRDELSWLPFWNRSKDVAAQKGLPFMALIHRNGENRLAYGLLDQLTETRLQADLSEISRCYHMAIQKPANKDTNQQRIPVAGIWEEVFFVSTSHKKWHCVLSNYVQQVTKWMKQPLMPVPEHAYDPVFCTWTAIHHDVSHDWIMKNAPLAAELGFRTWLTDDGWFLDKGEFGNYEQVGEWRPNATKFPDFAAHVEAVKALGFRYILWVSPFMIGVNSKQAKQYSHLLTDGQERERFRNLSPWHPEVAEIIKTLLKRLIEDYKLDGLKIDFIDSISVHSARKEGASEQSLGASVYRILQESIDELISIQPNLLIEFRNAYTNLASRRYANLYRSSDIPFNFALNRWQAVMLRLLVPDRAVHMDPILWHPEDTDENVALHLISGIASVPMISIELDEYPQKHLDMIRYWIGFYNSHRQTIIHGDFRPQFQPTQILLIDFVGENEVITGLYESTKVTRFDEVETQWILNASPRAFVEFENLSSKASWVVARDKYGNVVYKQTYETLPSKLEIEVGGSIEIRT